MANILITERQLTMITKESSSQNSQVIVEAEWYNLVGDILGIADPTGVIDIVNGVSYFSQGDHLFGLLSLISAIPYAGDVAAKPVNIFSFFNIFCNAFIFSAGFATFDKFLASNPVFFWNLILLAPAFSNNFK